MSEYGARGIGRRVAAYRKAAGMTAEQLAEKVGEGMTRTGLAKLENGHRKEVSTELLVQLAWALEVPPIVLLFPLDDRERVVQIGDMSDTVERLGYWIEGLALPSPDAPAASIGAAVRNAYRRLAVSGVAWLADATASVDAQGSSNSQLQSAIQERWDASSDNMISARQSLDMLKGQLGTRDG